MPPACCAYRLLWEQDHSGRLRRRTAVPMGSQRVQATLSQDLLQAALRRLGDTARVPPHLAAGLRRNSVEDYLSIYGCEQTADSAKRRWRLAAGGRTMSTEGWIVIGVVVTLAIFIYWDNRRLNETTEQMRQRLKREEQRRKEKEFKKFLDAYRRSTWTIVKRAFIGGFLEGLGSKPRRRRHKRNYW